MGTHRHGWSKRVSFCGRRRGHAGVAFRRSAPGTDGKVHPRSARTLIFPGVPSRQHRGLDVALIALLLFIVVERRALEPVLPLHLFATRTVWVTSIIATVAGFIMFGAITCLRLFLQGVRGA